MGIYLNEDDLNNYKQLKKQELKDYAAENMHNSDQIKIINKLIDRCQSKDELDALIALVSSRVKLGFTFDEAPIIKTDKIYVLEKDEKLSFPKDEAEIKKEINLPQHKLIIGDNYDALNNLLITHRNKINIIYIYPLYYAREQNFGYENKFSKTAWLNYMKQRMLVAYELLSDDGAIFISLDDNMQAYFKVMMDEIFGEENFVCNFIWEKKNDALTGGSELIKIHTEYSLMYAKNIQLLKTNKIKLDVENDDSYNLYDEYVNERGKYKLRPLDISTNTWVKAMDYPIFWDGNFIYAGGKNKEEWDERQINHKVNDWRWIVSQEKFYENLRNNLIVIRNGRVSYKQYQFVDNNLNYIERTKPYSNLIFSSYISSKDGTQQLKNIFYDEKVIEHPKPSEYVKYLLNVVNNKNAIVLDFYAGSGATAHAVLELNREDNGQREYILCANEFNTYNEKQNDNKNKIAIDVCYERLYRINNGKTTGGRSDFKWLEKNKPYHNPLNVYWLKEIDVSINKTDWYKKIDFNVYNQLNQNLHLSKENAYLKLYPLLNHFED